MLNENAMNATDEALFAQQQVARLQALLEASRRIHSTIALDQVLDTVLQIVVRELELTGAFFTHFPNTYGDVPPQLSISDRDTIGENLIQRQSGQDWNTDLWLHFTGPDINGVTVLTRSPRDMSVIQITCELRPLDLVHLSGHFGIPKVDPNAVMVPAPAGR